MEQGQLHYVKNTLTNKKNYPDFLMAETAEQALAFHRTIPGYEPTPLYSLPGMAQELSLGELYVKDESPRFGLNAFKVLGASYAMAHGIADLLGMDLADLSFPALVSDAAKKRLGEVTFFTATDGNHGRGVAWMANKLGAASVVFMPKGSTGERLMRIRAEGAAATIEEANYDDCVRMAVDACKKSAHGIVIQDTAWAGYEEVPRRIMQGYTTMAAEAATQLASGPPTHVFIQAGVGSLAGAVIGYYADRYRAHPPVFVVVEAQAADCLYKSAKAGDGAIRRVTGDMPTIMAGLACGEPNPIAWKILRDHADFFVSLPDESAARGMRMLAAPVSGDMPITSGESGAAGFAALADIMTSPGLSTLRDMLGLSPASRVLLFSTEGDTDRRRYKDIVWNGKSGGFF